VSDRITIDIPQMPRFLRAVGDVPAQQLKFMKSELGRGLNRMRTRFRAAQLHGPPGIHGEQKLSKGKNTWAFLDAKSLDTLSGSIGISRLLNVHEKGLVIRAKGGGLLFLRGKGTAMKKGPVFAVVKQVTIPSRLRFQAQVLAEAPAMLVKVAKEGLRATEVTLRKGLQHG
jgi:hypothetical protein